MSEPRYTVTEGRLRELMTGARLPMFLTEGYFHGLLSTLTPDPEPSGQVVERIEKILVSEWGKSFLGGYPSRLASVLTAEVTRQVEERTRGYREALEQIERMTCEALANPADNDSETLVVICTIAEDALANKGGSD